MGAPSTHKLQNALRAALDELGEATPETLFAFLRPDRIERRAAELAGDDPDARVSATWIRKLASRHGGFDKAAFGLQMFGRSMAGLEAIVEVNAVAYQQMIDAIKGGAGREAVTPALIGFIKRRTDPTDNQSRARKRIYHLALAATDGPEGREFRGALEALHDENLKRYRGALRMALEAADKSMAGGRPVEQLAHAGAALIEGYAIFNRSGPEIDEEEIVDACLRLIAAHTRGEGEVGLDPDRALFGRPRREGGREPVSGSVLKADAIHQAIIDAVEEAEPGSTEVVRHAMLHAPAGSAASPRTEEALAMATAIFDHVRAGGELRLLVTVDTAGQLERILEIPSQLLGPDALGTLEVRTLIGAAPMISPLIVGERVAAIAREGDGQRAVVGGLQLIDPGSIELLTQGFDDTWSSPKAITLVQDSEPYPRGIRAAEAELGVRPAA